MTGEQFIAEFEGGTVSSATFHHADHVELAFAYIQRFSVLQALERFCNALKRFATAQGKPERYHETITFAYFFLIRERMVRTNVADWKEFAERNADLLVWSGGILDRYYQESTLKSDLARATFILPDKKLAAEAEWVKMATAS